MIYSNFVKAALVSAAGLFLTIPSFVSAETLRIMSGSTSNALKVPMNRATVVESDRAFGELSIANPGIADISSLSDRTIYVLGKEPGRTTLTILDQNGRLITNAEIHVTPDIAEFKERLKQILPAENIEVRTANDGIVLSGTVSSVSKLERALELAKRYAPERVSNLMSVGGTQQVMLKVRFAEMQRSVTKSLSSSLIAKGTDVAGLSSFSLGAGKQNSSALSNALSNNSVNRVRDGSTGTLFGFKAGGLEVGLMLEALENKGVVRTLAEPNLTALSGQEANFLAGGEFPIPVARDENEITVDYKRFGVELTFIPRVIDGDTINLELNAAVSALDRSNSITVSGLSLPAFSRRESRTTVEMRDGESFAIAGLLSDDFTDSNSQLPWIGDVPVLGSLFRSAEYERRQTELVIIVTPHLVTPTNGEALALPTDRVQLPSETDLFLFGKTEGDGATGEVARQDFSGSYGYVLDE